MQDGAAPIPVLFLTTQGCPLRFQEHSMCLSMAHDLYTGALWPFPETTSILNGARKVTLMAYSLREQDQTQVLMHRDVIVTCNRSRPVAASENPEYHGECDRRRKARNMQPRYKMVPRVFVSVGNAGCSAYQKFGGMVGGPRTKIKLNRIAQRHGCRIAQGGKGVVCCSFEPCQTKLVETFVAYLFVMTDSLGSV